MLEFDPSFAGDATAEDDAREFITTHIEKSPHYENRVATLSVGGDKEAVRALVMLIRDKPTSYESDSPGAATMRHEIWQYYVAPRRLGKRETHARTRPRAPAPRRAAQVDVGVGCEARGN